MPRMDDWLDGFEDWGMGETSDTQPPLPSDDRVEETAINAAPFPIPADVMTSFESHFNLLRLEEALPIRMVWDLKNIHLAAIALAYSYGVQDGVKVRG